ncbi:MAG: hypothetical protein ACRKGH_06665 [Dehalogenimonas sp.]
MNLINLNHRISVALLVALMVTTASGCNPSQPSNFIVASPPSGSTTNNSIAKFEGFVGNEASSVSINGSPAYVANGTFFGFVSLVPGENLVDVETELNGKIISEQVSVTFTPPLSVSLFEPNGDQGTDYRTTPFPINGYISNPEAIVKINGESVQVKGDGEFTAQVTLGEGGGEVTAIAVLEGETDDMTITVLLDEQGLFTFDPYSSDLRNYRANVSIPNSVVIDRGETVILEWELETQKGIRNTGNCEVSISSGDSQLPTGLSIEPFPVSSIVYSNSSYVLNVIITTTLELEPGIYAFYLDYRVQGLKGSFKGSHLISLEVK